MSSNIHDIMGLFHQLNLFSSLAKGKKCNILIIENFRIPLNIILRISMTWATGPAGAAGATSLAENDLYRCVTSGLMADTSIMGHQLYHMESI